MTSFANHCAISSPSPSLSSLCVLPFSPFFPDIVPHRLFLFLHSPRSRTAVSRSPRTPFETGRSALHGVYTLLSRYVSQFDVRRYNGAQGDQPSPHHTLRMLSFLRSCLNEIRKRIVIINLEFVDRILNFL